MTLVERVASALGLLGLPVGWLSPNNMIADVCGSFITADKLADHGVNISGRTMSTEEFTRVAENYVGIDLVSEVLEAEVRTGETVRDLALQRAERLVEKSITHPDWYAKSIADISRNILTAQKRLNS